MSIEGDMTDETPAPVAPAGGAPATPTASLEAPPDTEQFVFEGVEREGEEDGEDPAAQVDAGDTTDGEPSSDDPIAALRQEIEDRVAAAERRANEAEAAARRAAGKPEGDKQAEEDERILSKRPETMDELMAFMEAKHRKEIRAVEARSAITAKLAASEQRARGLFSASSMGSGADYDAMISRYVAPIEEKNSAFRELMDSQPDPAVARYTMAVMTEISRKFAGDPVKTFKAVRSALSAVKDAETKVLDTVKKGAKAQAARVMGASAPGKPARKIAKGDIWKMSDKEFERMVESVNRN